MQTRQARRWGCSKCHWAKHGCIVCRKRAIDGARSYYVDADGYIARREGLPNTRILWAARLLMKGRELG